MDLDEPATSSHHRAVTRCVASWRAKPGNTLESSPEGSRTVLVTAAQWQSVLDECEILDAGRELQTVIGDLAMIEHLAPGQVGKSLFSTLDRLHDAHSRARCAFADVGRFIPPDSIAKEAELVHEAAHQVHTLATAVLDWASGGLVPAEFPVVSAHRNRCAGTLRTFIRETLRRPAPAPGPDQRFERSLGLSTAAMQDGDGHSWGSRLMVAWSKQSHELDERLFTQLPHLLDPTVALNLKVRQHAAELLVRDFPLACHAAAVGGRDLVRRALTDRREEVLAVIGEGANDESSMLLTHRRFVAEFAAMRKAEYEDDRVGPACDAYLTVFEGEVRRTMRTVLRLAGRHVRPETTLGQLTQHLAGEDASICALLLSCSNAAWRNAIAHGQVRWNPTEQSMFLQDEPVGVPTLIWHMKRAVDICAGFQTGLAIALNEAGNPEYGVGMVTDTTGRDGEVARLFGLYGISAAALRRDGRTLRIQVRDLPADLSQQLFTAIFVGNIAAPGLDEWVIQKDESTELVVDAANLHVAAEVVESGNVFEQPALAYPISLILCAGALRRYGISELEIGRTALASAAATIMGEYRRLKPFTAVETTDEFLRTVSLVHRAVQAIAAATGHLALRGFGSTLSALASPSGTWPDELAAVESTRRSHPFVTLPWFSAPAGGDDSSTRRDAQA